MKNNLTFKTNNYLIKILILASCIIIFFTLTYLLINNLSTSIFGGDGDSFSTLYYIWWIKDHAINYGFPTSVLFILPAKIGSILFGEIITYNIFVLSGFILTGLAGFLLIKKITKNIVSSVFGSLVLANLPFRTTQSLQHLNFADLSGLLFFIYFLILTKENPNFKNIFFSGLFFILTTLWNYQYGFFALIIFIIFIIFALINKLLINKDYNLNSKRIIFILFIMISCSAIITIFNLQAIKDYKSIWGKDIEKVTTLPIRSQYELKVYSAKWFYYLLPSPDNPVFGKLTVTKYDQTIQGLGTNQTEQVNYLGWIPLLLALLGIMQVTKLIIYNFSDFQMSRDSVPLAKESECWKNLRTHVWFFVLLGLSSLALSFSDTWVFFGYNIKSPAQYLFNYIPFFRVYSRFGLLVGIATTVLASIGLTAILAKISKIKPKYLVFIIISILTISELLVWPKDRLVRVDYQAMPEVYKFLAKEPQGLLVEYPLLSSDNPKSYEYLVWQRYHQFPLVYGSVINSKDDDFRETILNPEDSKTIDKLIEMKVKYLIVHENKYNIMNAKKYPQEYNYGKAPVINNNKIKLINQSDDDKIYSIID